MHCLQDVGRDPASLVANKSTAAGQGGGFMDTILNLIPGRRQQLQTEPDEEAIKRTHDYLR